MYETTKRFLYFLAYSMVSQIIDRVTVTKSDSEPNILTRNKIINLLALSSTVAMECGMCAAIVLIYCLENIYL